MNTPAPILTPGDLVTIDARAFARGIGRGHSRGRLLAVGGGVAVVKPFGRHRKAERLPVHYVKVWRSGLRVY